MSKTTKELSTRDGDQTLQSAYNEVDASFTVNSFLVGKIGHKIEFETDNEVVTITFSDGDTELYTIELTYSDNTLEELVSAERIS